MISGHEFDEKYGRLEDFMHRTEAGDFDNDGDIDIIWASWDWHGTAGKSVCLWNDGTGRMTSKICADIGGMQVKHGDFNADGHIDMLIADYSSECVKWAGGYKKLRMQSRQRGTSRILFGDGSKLNHLVKCRVVLLSVICQPLLSLTLIMMVTKTL